MRVEIVDYQPEWPEEFAVVGTALRDALGERAAIHHIGSTSVPGLAAKDLIDVQVTVRSLGQAGEGDALLAAGFASHGDIDRDHRPPGHDGPDEGLRKRMFTERPGDRRTNIHVRVAGAFNQRYAILFRDYVRAHPLARDAYGHLKKRLVVQFDGDRDRYYDIKDPAIDMLMAGAEEWARASGWEIPPSDA